MSMNVKDVQYSQYHGDGNIETGIAEACRKAGLPHNDHWVKGYSMRQRKTAVSLSVLAGVSALTQHKPRRRVGRARGFLATALLCAAALGQPNLAYAGPHGGGGGFHNGGGFHGAGFHGGGFDDGRFRGDHHGRFGRDRFHRGRFFFGSFYGASGWAYFCSNPVGYYPNVTVCNTGWQTAPGS